MRSVDSQTALIFPCIVYRINVIHIECSTPAIGVEPSSNVAERFSPDFISSLDTMTTPL